MLKLREIIDKSKQIHGNKYDYSLVPENEYKNTKTKCPIICHEKNETGHEHGVFYMDFAHHIYRKQGCPKCNKSHMEIEVAKLLTENNIQFIEQKRFEWLGLQSLDFYLPEHNIAIECQGEQHFKAFDYFGGQDGFLLRKARDAKKYNVCQEHNIMMFYFTHFKTTAFYQDKPLFTNSKDLINAIYCK